MQIETLTFVVLTRNEGKRLDRALASLPPGARIFVLDAQSTDDTVTIASRYGALVEVRAWTTFADARRHAITRVQTPWLFMLDADEALTPVLAASLAQAREDIAGYRCLRLNRLCGKIMRGGAWANEMVLRLVQTPCARIEAQAAGDLHEQLVVEGVTGVLNGAIDHDSYPSIASYRQKFQRYTAIEASGQSAGLRDVVTVIPKVCARALWQLTVRRGYRDGWRGLFVACASAAYPIAVRYQSWRLTVRRAGSAD